MEKEFFVSIIIPIYNGEKYVLKCLKQLLNQKFTDFEVIFIDDNSKDNSENVIKQFLESKIEYIYIKQRENHGVAYSKNLGIRLARGKYIMFHDQDDWMESDCLVTLYEYAKETNADRITGAYREIDDKGNILREVHYDKGFSKWFCTALHGVIFRREVFINYQLSIPASTLMEDAYVNCMFTQYAKKCVYIEKIIFNYLIREDSSSGAKTTNEKYNSINLFQSALECFVPLYKSLDNDEDRADIEYMVVKQFFWYLLHNNRYSSYKQILMDYKKLQGMIKKEFPNYKRNIRITLFKQNGDRISGRRRTYIIMLVHKLGFMKLFLWMYQKLSKVKYLT